MAIKSFRDKRTQAVFNGETPKGVSTTLARQALRKLRLLDQAHAGTSGRRQETASKPSRAIV